MRGDYSTAVAVLIAILGSTALQANLRSEALQPSLRGRQRLIDVLQDVIDVLDANGETDQILADA